MRKKIIVKCPSMSQSGYGEQARFALRALREKEDLFDIYLINIPWETQEMPFSNKKKNSGLIILIQKHNLQHKKMEENYISTYRFR